MFFESVCRSTPGVPDVGVPHVDNVVIPTASEESAIRGPLDSAHIQGVSLESVCVELRHPDIIVVDVSRLGSTGEEVGAVVPRQTAHTGGVCPHSAHHLAGIHIPQLFIGEIILGHEQQELMNFVGSY